MLTMRGCFWCLWSVLLLVKLTVAAHLPLFGDEAWYWLESQHPAWAYSDLPGLTAWLIGAGTWVAGDTWFGVRWILVLLGMLVPWLLMRCSARWFGEDIGWQAGVLALLLPLLGGLGFLALPDTPLTLAAMCCLLGASQLRERIDAAGLAWLVFGLVVGALSHYRFALLIVAGAAGLLADVRGRAVLRDVRVWGVLLVGALAWWPLLHWNLLHGNAGLDFQLRERHPWSLHSGGFSFLLAQVVVIGPLLFVLLLATLRHAWRLRHAPGSTPWWLIVCTAAVPALVYVGLSFVADRERVNFHWLLQACLPLLAAAPLVLRHWSRGWQRWLIGSSAMLLLAVFVFVAMAATPAWRAALADSRWYPDNFAGWEEVAAFASAQDSTSRRGVPLLADNFMLGAQLAFALRDPHIAILDHLLNHKHGRAAQLALWGATPSPEQLSAQAWTVMVEDSATPMRARLRRDHQLCTTLGAMASPQVLNVDHGRKRFLRIASGAVGQGMGADAALSDAGADASACVLPARAWIDTPAIGATVAGDFDVAGWAFKDGAGIARVEVLLDGRVVAAAQYGAAQPHVAEYWRDSTDSAHPHVGFHARVDASRFIAGMHWLGLRLHGRDGSVEDWPEQRVLLQ